MKANEILKQTLEMNCIEQQGLAYSYEGESAKTFVRHWFGSDADIVVGRCLDCEPKTWFYTYCEPLKGIADMIIESDGCRIWVYEVE